MKQTTLKDSIHLEGVGLHTGQVVKITIQPSTVNHGLKFKRTDIEKSPIIPATADYVISTNRSTTIGKKEVTISTVEHLLAAFVGCGVDNALIEVDGGEIPIMDGSSKLFIDAIQEVGIETLEKDNDYLIIESAFSFTDEATGTEFVLSPAEGYSVTTLIDFDSPVLGQQYAQLDSVTNFNDEIGSARTFAFLHEVEELLDNGLIKGGDLDNAIVVVDKELSDIDQKRLVEKTGKTNIAVQKGILNTTALRFNNEPARHKLLDVVGDLALVGKRIKGKIIATKPGHTANTALAKHLKAMYNKQRKLRGVPKYDISAPIVYDTMQIAAMLPHRYPFLLIDKITELGEKHVVGIKNITFNENFFQGHFPNNPVMPGVLQLEAMAQTGGILALSMVEEPDKWDTYFLKIDKAKFKRKVVPGDTVIFKLELLAPIRRGIVHMKGTAYVGENLVSEGELTAQIVKAR
ncbi:MAG: bifunctional UDP-3-O-[3-hydroxymyristoyl] N-acetylglucosamine deacetylase/3-hydroxyacyl-ACP dehydratase [Saprospiraceae bacterium]